MSQNTKQGNICFLNTEAGIFERCNTDGKLIECEDQNANCRNNCVQDPVCICSDKYYLSLSGNCSTYGRLNVLSRSDFFKTF